MLKTAPVLETLYQAFFSTLQHSQGENMADKKTVRIILKKPRTGGHGELLTEEYKTVDIESEELEKLLVGNQFFGSFSVVGAELIDPEDSKERHNSDLDF